MAQFSFDIVSDYDKAEIDHVVDQSRRELVNRYDFKGTPAAIDWLGNDKTGVTITGNGTWQIDAILDILRKKIAARGQSQKVLDTSVPEVESNLKTTKQVPFKRGLDQTKAKQITSLIREHAPKTKTQIQGDVVRVTGTSKNELQDIIQLLRTQDFPYPLDFTNYR